ncbi:hypothetical protein SALBM135S_00999 [Streptomyces alboniger]
MPKLILPIMFCWTISPIGEPSGRSTTTRDFMNFAGRVSSICGRPWASRISSLCVRNWSTLETKRATFFRVLWPTCTTVPSVLPDWSMTLYSLVSSMSLAFWFTTRTGSVKSVPPPACAARATPACCCTWRCTFAGSVPTGAAWNCGCPNCPCGCGGWACAGCWGWPPAGPGPGRPAGQGWCAGSTGAVSPCSSSVPVVSISTVLPRAPRKASRAVGGGPLTVLESAWATARRNVTSHRVGASATYASPRARLSRKAACEAARAPALMVR